MVKILRIFLSNPPMHALTSSKTVRSVTKPPERTRVKAAQF